MTVIDVAQGRSPWEKPLREPAVDAFSNFLLEVADIVGGKDRLHVGQEPLATCAEIKIVACEADIEALVGKVVDIGPIVVVAAGAVYLVHDETLGFSLPQALCHGGKDRPSAYCGGLHFAEPLDDSQSLALGIANDDAPLLGERSALALHPRAWVTFIILFWMRDTDISEESLHTSVSLYWFVKVRPGSMLPGRSGAVKEARRSRSAGSEAIRACSRMMKARYRRSAWRASSCSSGARPGKRVSIEVCSVCIPAGYLPPEEREDAEL